MFAKSLGGDRLGYMPLNRGYGFVDVSKHGGDEGRLLRTLAHELGHGAFGLEHLDSRYGHLGYAGGGTDNLMDSGEGTHLSVWQWNNIHDPEVKLPGSKDDGAGESLDHYHETDADRFAAALSALACAGHRGEAEAVVTLPTTVTARDGVDVPVRWRQGGVALEASSTLAGPRRVSTAAPEREPTEDGERVRLRFAVVEGAGFAVECSAEDAEAVADWFEGGAEALFAAEAAAVATGAGGGDDALFGALVRLSPCAMERVGAADRMAYVGRAVDDWYMNAAQERIVGRLFAEVGDAEGSSAGLDRELTAFGEALAGYGAYERLFRKMDDDAGALRDVLAGLLRAFWAVTPAARPSEVAGGADRRAEVEVAMALNMRELAGDSGGGTRTSNISVEQLPGGALEFELTVSTLSQYGGPGYPSVATTATMPLDTARPMEAVVAYAGPGQGDLGLAEGQYMGLVPAAYCAALAVRRTEALAAMRLQVGLDMALAMTGVGELNAALVAWRQYRTTRALARVTLAVADLATVNADIACADGEGELCREWQRVSMYVQLGLLSASAADGLAVLVERTARGGAGGSAVAWRRAIAEAGGSEEFVVAVDEAIRAGRMTADDAAELGRQVGARPGLAAGLSAEPELLDVWRAVSRSPLAGDLEWLRHFRRYASNGVEFVEEGGGYVMRRNGYDFGDVRGGKVTIRYGGPYGDLELSRDGTTTVMGRLVRDGGSPDEVYGTNYFRWLAVSAVGVNRGGVNVLDINPWDWGKNHAWMRAAVDNGDEARMVTPFTEAEIITARDKDLPGEPVQNMTVTGFEFAVLLDAGYGIDRASGFVRPLAELTPEPWWDEVLEFAQTNPQYRDYTQDALDHFDEAAYQTLRTRNLPLERAPRKGQGQFFGGKDL